MTWMLLTVATLAFAEPAGSNAPTEPVAPLSAPDFSALAGAAFEFAPDAQPMRSPAAAPGTLQETTTAATAPSVSNATAPGDAATSAASARDNLFFQRGSWRWQVQLAGATNFKNDAFGLAGIGVSYFIEDDFTIDFELNGLYFDQADTDNTAGINLAMQLRWHFWRSDDAAHRWSMYVDAGLGVMFSGDDVPAGGEHFSFTPQAGVGFSLLLDEQSDARLLAGLRWHHTSNANLFENNTGTNKLMLYAGVNLPF